MVVINRRTFDSRCILWLVTIAGKERMRVAGEKTKTRPELTQVNSERDKLSTSAPVTSALSTGTTRCLREYFQPKRREDSLLSSVLHYRVWWQLDGDW